MASAVVTENEPGQAQTGRQQDRCSGQPLGRAGRVLSSTCLDGIACTALVNAGKMQMQMQTQQTTLTAVRAACISTHTCMHACVRAPVLILARVRDGPWQIRFKIAQRVVGLLFGAVDRYPQTRLDQNASAMQEVLWQNHHHNVGSQWRQAIACSSYGGELVGRRGLMGGK